MKPWFAKIVDGLIMIHCIPVWQRSPVCRHYSNSLSTLSYWTSQPGISFPQQRAASQGQSNVSQLNKHIEPNHLQRDFPIDGRTISGQQTSLTSARRLAPSSGMARFSRQVLGSSMSKLRHNMSGDVSPAEFKKRQFQQLESAQQIRVDSDIHLQLKQDSPSTAKFSMN